MRSSGTQALVRWRVTPWQVGSGGSQASYDAAISLDVCNGEMLALCA